MEYRTATLLADGKRISGYALTFNYKYSLPEYDEIILPESISEDFLKKQDVLALFNHDTSRVLARNCKGKGTLSLSLDSQGLRYSFKLKENSALHNEVYELINSGELFSSSFGFQPDEDRQQWQKQADGRYLRTIGGFKKLVDVSPCLHPANPATTCTSRFYLENIKTSEPLPNNKLEELVYGEIYKRMLTRYLPDTFQRQQRVLEIVKNYNK